jgi:hypothetical protein
MKTYGAVELHLLAVLTLAEWSALPPVCIEYEAVWAAETFSTPWTRQNTFPRWESNPDYYVVYLAAEPLYRLKYLGPLIISMFTRLPTK